MNYGHEKSPAQSEGAQPCIIVDFRGHASGRRNLLRKLRPMAILWRLVLLLRRGEQQETRSPALKPRPTRDRDITNGLPALADRPTPPSLFYVGARHCKRPGRPIRPSASEAGRNRWRCATGRALSIQASGSATKFAAESHAASRAFLEQHRHRRKIIRAREVMNKD